MNAVLWFNFMPVFWFYGLILCQFSGICRFKDQFIQYVCAIYLLCVKCNVLFTLHMILLYNAIIMLQPAIVYSMLLFPSTSVKETASV